MTRKYSLVIEGDSGGYSAYVPELPAILVTGATMEELTARAAEAIEQPKELFYRQLWRKPISNELGGCCEAECDTQHCHHQRHHRRANETSKEARPQ